MKKASLILFFLSYSLLGQEFYPPEEIDLMNVALSEKDMSEAIMVQKKEKDCDAKPLATKEETQKPNQIFCLCEVKALKEKDQSILSGLIGTKEYDEIVITTGNDNFLHGALQVSEKFAKYDGDDKGRTFNGAISYQATGKEGALNLTFDSTGFGKYTTVDGAKKTPDKKQRYLNFHEVNTFDVRIDRNFIKNENGSIYAIGEAKLTYETDDGRFARSTQEWWHRTSKELGANTVQYKYISEVKDQTTISVIGGLGQKFVKDIGNWKCQSVLEAKGGYAVTNRGKTLNEYSLRAEGTVRNKSLPWLSLSGWLERSNNVLGKNKETGINIMMEKKINKVIVKPFIGIEKHWTTEDKRYGGDGKPYQNYYVVGVSVRY